MVADGCDFRQQPCHILRSEILLYCAIVCAELTVSRAQQILAELSPSMPYEKDGFSGELVLDHTTLSTEASGYTTKYSKTTETKVIGNLDRNDISYVPATTVKNGKTPLSLRTMETAP